RARLQARVLLLAVEGVSNAEIARRCHLTDDTVRAWRKQFTAHGLGWIGRIAPGRGRKPSVAAAAE
ncbi:MAG TPA: helix-turn-helix domain-containing protein, partial [Acidimicrobiales bacterium]|nr:helix-turn-helix domain-containing protein [Acidimicrobiales bacterium]